MPSEKSEFIYDTVHLFIEQGYNFVWNNNHDHKFTIMIYEYYVYAEG